MTPTPDEIAQARAELLAMGYVDNGDGTFVKPVKHSVPLCSSCFTYPAVKGSSRCDECSAGDAGREYFNRPKFESVKDAPRRKTERRRPK